MVQADATRNYYADLSVASTASDNEIRKAFRQLALKWHPDRNPGREAECVAKFQEIQAAHEILSDATQRAKYDQERRKYRSLNIPPYTPNTPRARPPPTQRNTYTNPTPSGGSYYRAPPPRPPPPQRPAPPQHHTTYANGADRFKNFRPPPTAQRPPPARPTDAEARANVFTAWQKMKQPRGEEPRSQNPSPNNANIPNPNGTPFGHTKSTRTPSAKKGFDPATPGGDEGQARSSYRSHYERPVPSPPHSGDPLKHFKSQMDDSLPNVPYAEGNRVRTPYSSTAGEKTSMFAEGVARSSSVRNSPTHRATSSTDAGSYSDSGRKGQRHSQGDHRPKGFPQMYPSSSDDESEADVFRTRSGPPPRPPPRDEQIRNHAAFGAPPTTGLNASPNFKSRSDETINMKFSPSDWHGKFEGSADYFAPNIPKGATSKGRISPTRGRSSQRVASDRTQFSGQSQPPPSVSSFAVPPLAQMPPPPPPPPTRKPPATTFAQETWAETFKSPSFVIPQSTKDTSPRRGSTSTKRSKAIPRKPSVVLNGTNTDTDSDSSRPKFQAFAEEAEDMNAEPEAMDIDPATPPVGKPKPSSTGADQTFKRDTPIKFATPSKTAPSSPVDPKPASVGPIPNGPATAPSSATDPHPPTGGLNGLAGLRNVEPFLPSTNGGGLSGLNDLGATLPFESKASHTHPIKPNSAQKLKYPSVPNAPQPPVALNEANMTNYLKQMERYVRSYRDYNKTMMAHFAAREAELEGLDEHFTLNRGETTKGLGFSSYLKRMKADEEVMETWKVAQEMHIHALRQCEEVRNKALRFLT